MNSEPLPWEAEKPTVRECSEPDCKNKVIDGWRCNKCKDNLAPPMRVNGKRKWTIPQMQERLMELARESKLKKTGDTLETQIKETLF